MRARRERVRRRPRDPAHRPGYSLIEVLVTISLFTVIAVILLPVLFTSSTGERLDKADEDLKEITDALAAFYADVGRWPGAMTQLVSPIAGGDQDICGNTYGGRRTRWAGPYLQKVLPAGGLPVGVGTALDTFEHGVGPTIDYLRIVVTDVAGSDALALDHSIDGSDGAASGTVQWAGVTSGVVTLYWTVPITRC
jgi:prepilin-type N-terminal cleavage/methylation domain-containing protein